MGIGNTTVGADQEREYIKATRHDRAREKLNTRFAVHPYLLVKNPSLMANAI
jgi:hypothetical protein